MTGLGHKTYKCHDCSHEYNKRTSTAFNHRQYPTDVIMPALHYYYRFKVSLNDVVELMLMRDFHLSHQTVHNWVQHFDTDLAVKLRKKRYKQCGDRWHIDATYFRIE